MKRLIALAAIATLGAAGTAAAEPITLEPETAYAIQFFNLEQVDIDLSNDIDVPGTTDYGDAGNWGIIKVTTVQIGDSEIDNALIVGGGDTVFTSGEEGYIVGLFYDIDLTSGTTATGGSLELYWYDSNAVTDALLGDPLTSSNYPPTDATVDLFTGGTRLAKLDFASGCIVGDDVTTICSDIDLTTINGDGNANSFANVDLSWGGAWADILNGDWFYVDSDGDGIFGEAGETRDFSFRNNFELAPLWDGGENVIGLSSSDPATNFTATESVPEPFVLSLLGLGLMGLGARARRRKNEN